MATCARPLSVVAYRSARFLPAVRHALTYEADGSDRLDLTVGSFDDPYRFKPVEHSGCESWHREWLDTSALPAERTDQNERLVERWIKAVGKLPD